MQARSDGTSTLLRNLVSKLRHTPFHPQWFALFREDRNLKRTCAGLSGVVLDVGCADGKPRRYLPRGTRYVGVDYYSTAQEWYGTRPDIYADARALPLADASVDHSLLLDVLEHIPQPDRCLAELQRTLKRGGSLTIQVPFLYPVHDAPLDFHRWTRFGLQRAAEEHGFSIAEEMAVGHPLETAALNANIALSQTVINWMNRKNPLAISAILLPIAIPLINCLAWTFAALGSNDDLMPYAYRMVWIKD
jgi:SAM-dependent methyltransferase